MSISRIRNIRDTSTHDETYYLTGTYDDDQQVTSLISWNGVGVFRHVSLDF